MPSGDRDDSSFVRYRRNLIVPSRRILFSFAHPDDESFGSGGVISRYVADGAEVSLICATNGEVGTVAPEFMKDYASVAELRLAELDCAAAKLGFKQVVKLGYRDSGMMDSETSRDPRCLWQIPREQVIRRVVEVIRELRPQVVITFNKYGGYGHPDHIAIQQATVGAFHLAGDASFVTEGLQPYAPQKLYYTSIPRSLMRVGLALTHVRRQDPRKLGRNKDVDMLAILENAEPIHTRIHISDYYEAWDAANTCHASQLGGGMPRLPLMMRKTFAPYQGFTRVYPAPTSDTVDEYDFFTGVRLDE
jgi:mycothiol S-conjugate amidase